VLAALAIFAWTACATAPDRRPAEELPAGQAPEAPPAVLAEAAAAIRAAPAALGLTDAGVPAGAPRILLGPMVGHVTDRSAMLWLQLDRPGWIEAALTGEDGGVEEGEAEVRAEEGNVVVVEVDGLDPATRYTARFALDGRPLEARPEVGFRTFPREGEPARLRIALVSCARMAWDSVQPIWTAIARDRPDVVVWLGDNNYFERGDSVAGTEADYASLERMAYRHAELRALPTLQPVLRAIPNVAMWDDHDYAGSDSDRTFPLREGSAVLFTRYWANPYWGGPGLDGTWSHVEIGDVEIFLTDNRYWRDPNDDPDSPSKTMLGAAQKAWLKERLAESEARIKIVAVGTQVMTGYHEWESYAQFAHERDELFDWIRTQRIDGVVFVSGDRHLSELMRYEPEGGYPLYELTASPAANRPFVTGLEIPNPIRLEGYGAGDNYGLLDIDTTPSGGTIVFRIVDVEGREVFAHTASLDELRFSP
jgi:alkaline phosphatase D